MFSVIADSHIGERLDIFVQTLGGITRNRAQKLITAGDVTVNGATANKVNYRLRASDTVELNLPEPTEPDINPENIPIDVVFEDNDLIVVNKPKGMVVHPAAGHFSGTLVNALLHHCGSSLSGINGVLRPGIVHRIDKDTSGLLIAAKNDNSHNALALQFSEKTIKREYYAIVHGRLKTHEGTISAPIARHKTNRKKMAVSSDGREAVTHYQVMEEFEKSPNKFTLIKANLQTGRTHQIRVHMAHINHPVLGDIVYGSAKQPFGLESQVLHSRLLGFTHPATGEYMELETPLPPYFEEVLNKLNKDRAAQ